MRKPERGQPGVLGHFALLVVGVLSCVGITLGVLITETMTLTSLQQSAQVATVLADATVVDALGDDGVENGLSAATLATLDARLKRSARSALIDDVLILNADGRVVYARDRAKIDTVRKRDAVLDRALAGRPVARFARDPDEPGRTVIQATIALPTVDAGRAPGVVELWLPGDGVLSRIDAQHGRIYLILIVALAVLAGILLVIMWRAARRLRHDLERHEYLASHDSLTGLPNRVHLAKATDGLLGDDPSEASGALMLLDLDGFKDVNDSLGHTAGDDLLVDVAGRLRDSAPTGSTIARLGGDEFAVVMPGPVSPQRARAAARRMLVAFDSPFMVRDIAVAIDASVGIAIAGLHGQNRDELLQRADIAMYAAKRGKRRITVYSDDLDPMGADMLALVADLRRALDAGELRLHYQPKVNMSTSTVSSVEALVRWRHPTRGLLMPSSFIPFAERAGLIGKVSLWAIDEAVHQCRRWADQGHFLTVAINISQANLVDPSIGAALVEACERYGVPPNAVEIEVTESALTNDLDGAAEGLAAMNAHGVRITIDDYGTGYTSIAHLRALPVQCLKIDRSYVAGMLEDPASTSIVRNTMDLAHDLGLQVVAEGVETQVEFDTLASIGCDVAQGYFCARPMDPDALVEWLGGLASEESPGVPTIFDAHPPGMPDFEVGVR